MITVDVSWKTAVRVRDVDFRPETLPSAPDRIPHLKINCLSAQTTQGPPHDVRHSRRVGNIEKPSTRPSENGVSPYSG